MKIVLIASISIAAFSILAPAANAQQTSTTISLVQKLQPVIRSYPGVAADILGIQTTMTISQAEAIAGKNYQGKPLVYKRQEYFTYKEVKVSSHPFLQALRFANHMVDTSDELSLYFGSPVTGSALYGIARDVKFGTNAKFGYDPANAPLMSTLEASLMKKYGRPSYRNVQPDLGFYIFAWTFSQNSKASSCGPSGCVDGNSHFVLNPELSPLGGSGVSSDMTPSLQNTYTWSLQCSALTDNSQVFAIYARININTADRSKADELEVSIWDPSTCMGDNKEASKQLNAAAVKLYNSISKAPDAPKL